MRTFAGWYPGDGVVFLAVVALGTVAAVAALAWAADRLCRRAALRCGVWTAAASRRPCTGLRAGRPAPPLARRGTPAGSRRVGGTSVGSAGNN
ncbi:MAG: hypothetical protein U0797_29345 [Gemmataceae bacterium]